MKIRSLLLAVLVMTLMGCVKQKMLVTVNADGSGDIAFVLLHSPKMLEMLPSKLNGTTQTENEMGAPIEQKATMQIDEDKLQMAAATLGDGVAYSGMKPLTQNGWQGQEIKYAFSDVSKIKISLNQNAKQENGITETTADCVKQKECITFELTGENTKTLTIHMPKNDDSKHTDTNKETLPKNAAAKNDPMMQAMMMELMKGLEMRFAVRVNGKVVKNTASYKQDKNEIILLHIDFDKMPKSSKSAANFIKQMQSNNTSINKNFKFPGLKYESKNEVEIQFNEPY